MDMYGKKKWTFYSGLVEYYLRLAVRKDKSEIRGTVNLKWYIDTVHWLNEKCTDEERKLVLDFYTYSASVRDCHNYKVTVALYDIIDRFATENGLC